MSDTTKSAPDEEKRRTRRRLAIGAGVVGTAALVGLLLLPSDASAAGKRLTPPPRKKPSSPTKSGGGGLVVGPKRDSGGGDSSGGDRGGGTQGPGGGSTDGGQRTNPGGGGQRTNPGGGDSKGGKRVNPRGGGDRTNPKPVGPNPGPEKLPDYYSDEWPDPLKFYQVTPGGEDAKGLYNIARRYALSCLYLAATEVGGLDPDEAIEWAQARSPDSSEVREWADYILCVAWNDVHYGSLRVTANNRRGPHNRGIPLSPIHADNWRRILDGRSTLRNVRLHKAGEVGTPQNVGKGDRRLPLLWMPGLDYEVLWQSGGKTLRAGGNWANGFSYYFPPPIVMRLSVQDPTNAGLGVWGCGEGQADFG